MVMDQPEVIPSVMINIEAAIVLNSVSGTWSVISLDELTYTV